jgi:hypothetical protein
VKVVPEAPPGGVIEVEFTIGARLRIAETVDATTVSAAIAALARCMRRR